MPSPRLDENAFKQRFRSQFKDHAFAPLAAELDKIAQAAWEAYAHSRKSPHTRKAGPEFADPDYARLSSAKVGTTGLKTPWPRKRR